MHLPCRPLESLPPADAGSHHIKRCVPSAGAGYRLAPDYAGAVCCWFPGSADHTKRSSSKRGETTRRETPLLRRRCARFRRTAIAAPPSAEPAALARTISLRPRSSFRSIGGGAHSFGSRTLRVLVLRTCRPFAARTLGTRRTGRARWTWGPRRGRLLRALDVSLHCRRGTPRHRRGIRTLAATTTATASPSLLSFRAWRRCGRRRR